ncbi:MAG: cysteine desulfurase [Cyanobacteria bacterium HKST-UBA05]|nr:cysteine desulfurase [Cyanobacteria bacterium HKST-UBA05]
MIYLDYAATTPTHPEVVEAMAPYLTQIWGNPSSLHQVGLAAHAALESARQSLARQVGLLDESGLVFTSGGTESNNLAIKGVAGALQHKGRHLVTAATEHAAVLEPMRALAKAGWTVTELPVTVDGRVELATLRAALRPDTVLVSLMHGNNEVGTLQDIATLAATARAAGVLFHTDAVQTVGKHAVDMAELGVDLLSASAHKFYGPKGMGFLAVNMQTCPNLVSLLDGGGHEGGRRSGTQNVAGAVGMAKALALAEADRASTTTRLQALQARLWDGLVEISRQTGADMVLNGPAILTDRVVGNLNVSLPPYQSEALLLKLDMAGIAVSAGSACHSSQLHGSHVVRALYEGRQPDARVSALASSALRFSLGRLTTADEIEAVLAQMDRLSRLSQPSQSNQFSQCQVPASV